MSDNTSGLTVAPISLVSQRDREMASKIKMLLPYGANLTDDNAIALSAYSRIHGLDPFNGECYFLVKVKKDDRGNVISREENGVYPGIKGKRKKAHEQLQAINQEATYKVDYFIVGPSNVGLTDKNGEIALVVEAQLRDSVSTEAYLKAFYELQKTVKETGLIREILGKPPVWTGYGVVKARELPYLKQTPMTLAKKRAESDATNQRFDLPFSSDALADDIAPELINGDDYSGSSDDGGMVLPGIIKDQAQGELPFGQAESEATSSGDQDSQAEKVQPEPKAKITTEQAMNDLGFGASVGPKPPETPSEPEPVQNTLRNMAGPTAKKTNGEMTLEEAKTVRNSEDVPYVELETTTLTYMAKALNDQLKKGLLKDKEQEDAIRKQKAIQVILNDRVKRQKA